MDDVSYYYHNSPLNISICSPILTVSIENKLYINHTLVYLDTILHLLPKNNCKGSCCYPSNRVEYIIYKDKKYYNIFYIKFLYDILNDVNLSVIYYKIDIYFKDLNELEGVYNASIHFTY